jgi:hypothetical protein
MSNNSLSNTKINITYTSLLHANGIPLPVAGQEDIYDGNGNKSSLKLGRACNGATVCGTLSATTLAGNNLNVNTKLVPGQINILELVKVLYPIGAVIYTAGNVNPGTRSDWVGTTWIQISQGRFVAGIGTGTDSRTEVKTLTAGNNAGEYNHVMTVDEMPIHGHRPRMRFMSGGDDNSGSTGFMGTSNRSLRDVNLFGDDLPPTNRTPTAQPTLEITSTGGSQPHNNLPPSFGLYVWQRTA